MLHKQFAVIDLLHLKRFVATYSAVRNFFSASARRCKALTI